MIEGSEGYGAYLSRTPLSGAFQSSVCIFFLFESCRVERAHNRQGPQLQRDAGFDSKVVGARLRVPGGETEIDVIGHKMYLAVTRCDFTVGPMIVPSALEIAPIYHSLCF